MGSKSSGEYIMYLAGVYDGYSNKTPSHRAAIPSPWNLWINKNQFGDGNSTRVVGAALDIARGGFLNRTVVDSSECPGVTLEQRFFAHQTFKDLMVAEVRSRSVRQLPSAGSHCTVAAVPKCAR